MAGSADEALSSHQREARGCGQVRAPGFLLTPRTCVACRPLLQPSVLSPSPPCSPTVFPPAVQEKPWAPTDFSCTPALIQ